jgi:methylthioribulose 1-phosphate dehydratase/enolase-phosphatase E1
MAAVQATLIDENAPSLDLTHLEMLKGVGGHAYDDLLQVPIIDNRPTEDLLADQLEAAVIAYPKCNAALVRRHGMYASWQGSRFSSFFC